MMTRLVKILFFMGVALLITGLIAPNFINWNRHKTAVMARISPYFQRKIEVGGNISFQILPQPEILLEDVTIANADGSIKNPLMTLKSLEAEVSLAPLLQGQIVVKTVNLMKPVLNIEVYGNGKTNLSDILAPTDNLGAAAATQLDQVTVTDGTLRYANQLTGTHKRFDNLTLSISANTLLGPYHVAGSMAYQQTNAHIDIDTGAFNQTFSAPIKISFMPVENMPQIKIDGTIGFEGGVNLAGDLSISNGTLASLTDVPAMSRFSFWDTDVKLKGTMALKGGRFSLHDINASFGEDGTLRGEISVRSPRVGARDITADLSGENLVLTSASAVHALDVPAGAKTHLDFKGKNITWEGKTFKSVKISAVSKDKNWQIARAKIDLPGKSVIDFSGIVMPQEDSAIYDHLQVKTDNLGKMTDALAPSSASIFSMLGGENAPFKTLQMTGSLQISPSQISLYNIEATLDNNAKVSGALNVPRDTKKPAVTAMLDLEGWNNAAFSAPFLKALLQADADLQITADTFTYDDLHLSDVSFAAKTGNEGLMINKFDGKLDQKGTFSITGHVAGLAPVSGLDISYTLTAPHLLAIAKSLGARLPFIKGDGFSIKGMVKQTPEGLYHYTAAGQGDKLVLQDQAILHPAFTLDANLPASISISNLTGELWGGTLKGNLDFTAGKTSAWASTFKGQVKQADLHSLQKQLDLEGFEIGKGDLKFELTSADSTPETATGDISLQADQLTIDGFNAQNLAGRLRKLSEMPQDLERLVSTVVHQGGASVFKTVQGTFKIGRGRINIERLTAANKNGKISLTGDADIAAHSYSVSGILRLDNPGDFPSLALTRSSEDKDYVVSGGAPLKNYVLRHLPPVSKMPQSPAAAAPPEKKKDQPIGDILKRLNESSGKQGALMPSLLSPALPQRSSPLMSTMTGQKPLATQEQKKIENILQQVDLQNMLQSDAATMPLALTPPTTLPPS